MCEILDKKVSLVGISMIPTSGKFHDTPSTQ